MLFYSSIYTLSSLCKVEKEREKPWRKTLAQQISYRGLVITLLMILHFVFFFFFEEGYNFKTRSSYSNSGLKYINQKKKEVLSD